MSTTISPITGASAGVTDALRGFGSVFARFTAWLEARQRAYDDDGALAQLSDRDLHDIGLDRGFVSAVARGRWTREGPDL
jgi:uncharacterized protein YjiS (DUF1127 family)